MDCGLGVGGDRLRWRIPASSGKRAASADQRLVCTAVWHFSLSRDGVVPTKVCGCNGSRPRSVCRRADLFPRGAACVSFEIVAQTRDSAAIFDGWRKSAIAPVDYVGSGTACSTRSRQRGKRESILPGCSENMAKCGDGNRSVSRASFRRRHQRRVLFNLQGAVSHIAGGAKKIHGTVCRAYRDRAPTCCPETPDADSIPARVVTSHASREQGPPLGFRPCERGDH